MPQLARSDAINDDQYQPRGESEAYTQRRDQASLFLIALIGHQEIETAAQTRNQRHHKAND